MKEKGNDKTAGAAFTCSLHTVLHEHRLTSARIALDPEQSRSAFHPSLVFYFFKKPLAGILRDVNIVKAVLLF